MANSAGGNVVALGEHARARGRLPREEFADALSGCRRLALERMGAALSGMLDRIEDELFGLAEAARDRDQQNTYLDARAQARDKRAAIEATFRAHFVDLFDRKVRGGRTPEAPSTTLPELSLVEPEVLEATLAVHEMARKLGAACEGELFGLSQRMGFLLDRPELADEANPLSPATVCAALKDACDQIEASFKVRMALLQQLERHAESALNGVYHELNAHLIERHILPEVRYAVPRVARPAPRSNAQASPAAQGGGQADAPQADVFATLTQWMGATAAGPSRDAGGSAAGAQTAPAMPADNGAAASGAPNPEFMAQLTRMHREMLQDAAGSNGGHVNAVKAIKSSPLVASLGRVDAMTIDVVGMLFDYIFEDRHIPASVKAHLGRLQLPTLKVALLDKAFFSSSSHPARRLLDLLAECSIGLDESHARDSEVVRLVESVVATVLAEFESDLALFEAQAKRVEAFIEERREAETRLVERSAHWLEERERREGARVAARAEVESRIHDRPWLPIPVREMLLGTWVDAMAEASLHQGQGGTARQELVITMEELLWSVQPKQAAEDRRRLVSTLPGMLARIAAGLERGGMTQEARDIFFGALVDCHAGAVKAGLRGVAVLPTPQIPEDEPAGVLQRALVPAGDLQVEEIRLRPPRGVQALRNVFTRTGIWTNLQRGTWVEFVRTEGARMRARLTWISPNKAMYLFTNPLSQREALSISPEALAEQMRMGDARMLDDGPLVDRAVGSMMASLGARGNAA